MAEEAILQVKIDAELKEQAELLYQQLGTSFTEAITIFARQSVEDGAMPFTVHLSSNHTKRPLGLANGMYKIPENIDECNEEIESMIL